MVLRGGSVRTSRSLAGALGLLVACLLLGALIAPSALIADAQGAAAATNRIYDDWQADGEIEACDWTADQLRTARGDVQDDVEAYAPDFLDAIDDALQARASCGGGGTGGGGGAATGGSTSGSGGSGAAAAPTAAAAEPSDPAPGAAAPEDSDSGGQAATETTPTPGPVAMPAPQATDEAVLAAAGRPADGGSSSWIWAVLAGVIALALLAAWFVRWSGWEPRWAAPATHSIEEAGWRIGNRWSEFGDWMGRGR